MRIRSFLLAGCLAGLLPRLSLGQTPPAPTPATARVGQVQGKYVFCYTQPQQPYEVVFTFSTKLVPDQGMTLTSILAASVTSALTEGGAQLRAFDAVLIQAGERDLAIKFADPKNPDRALASVPRIGGKLVYLFCEPLGAYEVVKTEGISWYNHAFGGTYYSFAKVEENLLKTANKSPNVEAILFGETATYISFKK